MSSIFINQVTAHGEPEDVAALAARLESGDEEVQVTRADTGILTFTTWSRNGPHTDLYEEIREAHPDIRLAWLYYLDEEEVAGYLTEKSLDEWREWLGTADPSGRFDARRFESQARENALFEQAVSGLTEYYEELEDEEFVASIRDKVVVPDTGNDQEDYENVRDQVEWLVESRSAVLGEGTT
jgi:hypothetical protein